MSSQPVQYLTETGSLCQRCKEESAILISRKERFCKGCFIRFIRGKQRKQMQDEKYKVKYGEVAAKLGVHKVLLAVSGGISSLVLLDVMASLLQEQYLQHKGKQGFELVLLNLHEFELKQLNKSMEEVLPQLVEQYQPVKISYRVVSLDSYILDQAMLEKITINNDFVGFTEAINLDSKLNLAQLLQLCPNKSSVEDLLTIIYDELILWTAYNEGCQTILYGHSMTRLANEIIALTVKGRGSTIYRAISDHSVNFRDQEFSIIYPLREILYGEILAYGELAGLNEYVVNSTIVKSKITKNLTIRDLTTNYFTNLDATGYASTASTVVKTGEKLGAPTTEVLCTCQVCGVEIHQDPASWLSRITVNEPAPVTTEEEQRYVQMYLDLATREQAGNGEHLNVCYGCLVTLGGISPDTGFVWPVKTKQQQNTPLDLVYIDSNDKSAILEEYVLTDSED